MPKRIGKPGKNQRRRKTFLLEWREYRDMTQEFVAGKLDMSASQLSRIESGNSPYTQDFLEAVAVIYGTDPISLLTVDPNDEDAIWPIWESASALDRRKIVSHAKLVIGKEDKDRD